jgi:small subunit ribosomal protein S35
MKHRVITEVKKDTMGFPPSPSLGSLIGNPETPYQIAKNVKHHLARLSAMDTTHIRRKKDYGRYNFHRILRMAGMTFDQSRSGARDQVTSLTELQDKAELPSSHFQDRFAFPHVINYKAYWGPPTVETEPNRYEGSMVGVSVSFRVKDLLLQPHEAERMIEIVGPTRYDGETDVVTIDADIFPNRNHNAAFLGDVVQHLLRVCVNTPGDSKP